MESGEAAKAVLKVSWVGDAPVVTVKYIWEEDREKGPKKVTKNITKSLNNTKFNKNDFVLIKIM